MKTGIELIAQERAEQIEKHGWNNDKKYTKNELNQAIIFCLTLKKSDYPKNWDRWFYYKVMDKKRRMKNSEFKIEMTKIAGALCAAEIDRLLNARPLCLGEEFEIIGNVHENPELLK